MTTIDGRPTYKSDTRPAPQPAVIALPAEFGRVFCNRFRVDLIQVHPGANGTLIGVSVRGEHFRTERLPTEHAETVLEQLLTAIRGT